MATNEESAGIVLIVDDESDLRQAYRHILRRVGYDVLEADSAAAVRALLQDEDQERPEAVLLDVRLGEDNGLELLSFIADATAASVVVLSASRKFEDAVTALKNGAFDYLNKPVAATELHVAIRNAVERGRMQRELMARRALDAYHGPRDDSSAVFASLSMRLVRATLERVRDRKVPVLVLGESGTGKEVIARWVHETSNRSDGPFVAINCAALPTDLAEAELFGHEAGAFTGADKARVGRFEEASGGTLFLDELGELPAMVQAKLLRVLESGTVARLGGRDVEVDTRVLAATNRDLKTEVAQGRFRDDLFYRLDVISVRLPPLRERIEELPALCEFLLRRFVEREGLSVRKLTDDALDRLRAHHWPGNVRELENVLKRSSLLSDGPTISSSQLVFSPAAASVPAPNSDERPTSAPPRLKDMPEELARETMVRALAETRGNVSAAARRLGIGRSTFYRHARLVGLPT